MDELVQHCLTEIAFEGELGCGFEQLKRIIKSFYDLHSSVKQSIDNSYCSFLFSIILLQPSVKIGKLPDGQITYIYVPPQARVGRRGKGAEVNEHGESNTVSKLEDVPDATPSNINELIARYGESLRIAVDQDAIFVVLTGSHARPAKLTPVVYATLQIIGRARETGISSVDLGKATGYDQKTIHYLVGQLVDLNLVVKLRRGGNSTNFCVHKHYFDTGASWKAIRDEENRAKEDIGKPEKMTGDEDTDSLQFDPIDSLHLTNLSILRQRIIKLLNHSENEMVPYINIALRVGLNPRDRGERRFFLRRLRDLISEGEIEKVSLPNINPNLALRSIYIRLVKQRSSADDNAQDVVKIQGDESDDERNYDLLATDDRDDNTGKLKANVTFHRQILDLVERSGRTGITLNELTENLGQFDKRTVDQFLDRTLKQPPPPHLADLSIIQLGENYGKEKRHRYFTLPGYIELMAYEKFQAPTGKYNAEDVNAAGLYSTHTADEFYLKDEELIAHLMQYRSKASMKKGGNPRKETSASMNLAVVCGGNIGEGLSNPKKLKVKEKEKVNVKVKKEKVFKNPVLADGTRKRGRPVKDPEIAEQRRQKRLKIEARKRETLEVAEAQESTRKTRGKRKRLFDDEGESEPDSDDEPVANIADITTASEGPSENQATVNISSPVVVEHPVVKRKRGRPPKKPKIDVGEKPTVNASTTAFTSRNGSERPTANQFEAILEAEKSTNIEIEPTEAPFESIDVPPIDSFPQVGLVPLDGAVAAKSPTADDEDVSDFETEQSGPVGKLVPASFDQLAEQTPPCPSVADWQNLAQNVPDTPMSPLTELTEDGPATRSAEDPVTPEMVLFEETRDDPITGMPANCSHVPMGSSTEIQSVVPQTETIQLAQKPSDMTSISTTTSRSKKKINLPHRNTKKNISQIRRENEFVRLIENSGGIINTSTLDFFKAFTALIEAMIKAGEPTSAPAGTQIDRRTMAMAFDNLESDGRIKLRKTSVRTATSSNKSINIAYLPHIREEDIDTFSSTLGSPVIEPKGTEDGTHATVYRTEMDINTPQVIAKKWVEENLRIKGQPHLSRDPERVQRLFELNDEIIREALRMENQTISQAYGLLKGILMRARALHVHIVEMFDQSTANQYIDNIDRVVSWEYFDTDVPLSVYCTYMPPVAVLDEINLALETGEGQQMRIKNIPVKWKSVFRAGKAGSRHRIFQLLEILKALKIVTPMRVSITTSSVTTNNVRQFEPMPPGWEAEQPPVYPRYWQFTESAPIFLTALRELPPALYMEKPISSKNDVLDFWDILKFTSIDEEYCERKLSTSHHSYPDSIAYDERIRTTLGRSQSWKDSYCFTWHQTQFIDKHFDASESSEVDTDLIARVGYIISAPSEAVRRYVVAAREERHSEITRIQLREERIERKKQEAETIKALVDAKSKEMTEQRELEWKTLLEKVCDGPAPDVATTRFKQLRRSFMLGHVVQDTNAWEKQLKEAFRMAEKTKKLRDVIQPGISSRPMISASAQPVLMEVGDQPTEMVVDLQNDINAPEEKPKVKGKAAKPHKKKGGRKEDSNEMRLRSRRTRYYWGEDDDELVRDAYAIIQARCRSCYRVDYGAFAQLFKDLSSNTVRQHIGHLKEKPGAEGYLQRLEAAWMDLWSKHRGTAALPDDDPTNVTDFDLLAHIMFLRKHVDKDALRVGISAVEETAHYTLPLDLTELLENYELSEQSTQGLDFLSNASTGEEAREKLFLQDSIVLDYELQSEEFIDDLTALAESTLKVVMGTPAEDYDPHCAADILKLIGDERVAKASSNLLSQNVFSKLVRDPNRLAPGRSLKISESNQNALGGPVSNELFQDAVQSERTLALEQNEWREWPLMSTDGDTAALLQLFSDHKLSIKFDMDHAQKAIASLDGNSRKADDDDIEIQLEFRLKDNPSVKDGPSPAPDVLPENRETDVNSEHGQTVSGDAACCNLYSEGIVDCIGCIEDSKSLIREWDEEDQETAREILDRVESHGSQGVMVQKLQSIVGGKCMEIVKQIHSLAVPVVYTVGYHTSVLVSAKYVNSFTIILPQTRRKEPPSISKCFPRRWLDIKGNRITEVWEAALRSVVGLVHLRPGISHADLRQRLKPIYDRQEVMDLTLHLSSNDYLICRVDEGLAVPMLKAATDPEERIIHWFVSNKKHWFMAT